MKPGHNWEPGVSGATTPDSSAEGAENFKAERIFEKKNYFLPAANFKLSQV